MEVLHVYMDSLQLNVEVLHVYMESLQLNVGALHVYAESLQLNVGVLRVYTASLQLNVGGCACMRSLCTCTRRFWLTYPERAGRPRSQQSA